jgi:hypothetical protein
MFFLLRMMFWLAVVCVLLPGGGKDSAKGNSPLDTMQAPRKNAGNSQDTLTPVDTTAAFRNPTAQVPLPVASPRREAQNRRPSA